MYAAGVWDRNGIVIGWALRWVLLCCGVVLLGIGMLDRGALLGPHRGPSRPDTDAAASTGQSGSDSPNAIVYRANERGHVIVDAAVNGAPLRLLVDTGASLVTLTTEDARAAGLDPARMLFNSRVHTANGTARMAPVTLREIRIGQLSIYDVSAAVLENLKVSLLGTSFLSRLQGYEMRDGKLTINW